MASQIQQWALKLSCYQYNIIKYKEGGNLCNALSRLPRRITTSSDVMPGDLINLVDHLSGNSLTAQKNGLVKRSYTF